MTEYEDLTREIRELKDEIGRLREVVNMLFQIVVEDNGMDFEPDIRKGDDLHLNN